jgi:hypothetical protein
VITLRLVDSRQESGIHEVQWDGRDADGRWVASGVYFYRFESRGDTEARKMILVR